MLFCGAMLNKRCMERVRESRYDNAIKQTIRQAKQVPVLINYTVGGKRAEKTLDKSDLALIAKIDNSDIPYWFPTDRMIEGNETKRHDSVGITHAHHFYTKRSLWALGALYDKAFKSQHKLSIFLVQYAALGFSKISRYVSNHFSQVNRYLSGTLWIASQQAEVSPDHILNGKLQRFVKHEAPKFGKIKVALIGCCDSSAFPILSETFDYIFIDPPFGANLNYSELNFLWEQWLKVWTNNKPEAIINKIGRASCRERV